MNFDDLLNDFLKPKKSTENNNIDDNMGKIFNLFKELSKPFFDINDIDAVADTKVFPTEDGTFIQKTYHTSNGGIIRIVTDMTNFEQNEIDVLQTQLNAALKNEEYEKAADLRDRINNLTKDKN